MIRLAGLAANELRRLNMVGDPSVAVWHDAEGALTQIATYSPVRAWVSDELAGWTVTVLPEVLGAMQEQRAESGVIETGGILVGSWDRTRNIIYVVGAIGPPRDSTRERSGFVRGVVGLEGILEVLSVRTMGNVAYVGEWHTHPPGSGSKPSTTDRDFLQEMHERTRLEDAPALLLICGEEGVRVGLKTIGDDEVDQLLPLPAVLNAEMLSVARCWRGRLDFRLSTTKH